VRFLLEGPVGASDVRDSDEVFVWLCLQAHQTAHPRVPDLLGHRPHQRLCSRRLHVRDEVRAIGFGHGGRDDIDQFIDAHHVDEVSLGVDAHPRQQRSHALRIGDGPGVCRWVDGLAVDHEDVQVVDHHLAEGRVAIDGQQAHAIALDDGMALLQHGLFNDGFTARRPCPGQSNGLCSPRARRQRR
jgi:hypothetical protein